MSAYQLVNSVISLAHLFLVATGFALIYRTAKLFHFAHAAVYVVGAYTAYWVENNVSHNFAVKLFFGVAVGVITGCVIERLIYRTLRNGGAPLITFLVSSLGLLIVIQSILSLQFGDATLGLRSFDGATIPLQFMGGAISKFQLIFLGITILSGICLALFLVYSNQGIILRAVANNWDLSTVVGIDVNKSILVSIAIGSAFSSLAGIMWSHNTALHPNLGGPPLLSAITATVIGGASNLIGTFAGCVLVVALQQLSLWFLPGEWHDVVVFTSLLLFLIFKPHGILGKPVLKAEL